MEPTPSRRSPVAAAGWLAAQRRQSNRVEVPDRFVAALDHRPEAEPDDVDSRRRVKRLRLKLGPLSRLAPPRWVAVNPCRLPDVEEQTSPMGDAEPSVLKIRLRLEEVLAPWLLPIGLLQSDEAGEGSPSILGKHGVRRIYPLI